MDEKRFDHFLLGADFDSAQAPQPPVRIGLADSLRNSTPYLIVSTVEPRKNHAYLLDAFDELWTQKRDVSLFIVGRVGWKVDALLDRIRNHPQYGLRLFLWDDLNDAELKYCYAHARALLFPSFVEGFGLPIVEGLLNGLPVLASDTPIHREVGGSAIGYFDLDRPQALAAMITEIELQGVPARFRPTPDWRWPNWYQATSDLFDKTCRIAHAAHDPAATPSGQSPRPQPSSALAND